MEKVWGSRSGCGFYDRWILGAFWVPILQARELPGDVALTAEMWFLRLMTNMGSPPHRDDRGTGGVAGTGAGRWDFHVLLISKVTVLKAQI